MSEERTKRPETPPAPPKKTLMQRFLDRVEIVGNRLPQPVTLFAILMAVILVLSLVASLFGLSAVHPGTGETIEAVNLLSAAGVRRIFTDMVSVFVNFPPLGLVLIVMIGVGVAERSGYIAAALKIFVSKVPRSSITFFIVTAGMLSTVAADAGYVVLIPLGAAIFASMGRHPLAGLAAAFAGVSGGFGANLFPTSLDPMLAAFTESAAHLLAPGYSVNPMCNWWIMAASVPLVAVAGTLVTEKIVEPRLGKWEPPANGDAVRTDDDAPLSPLEQKGVRWGSLSILFVLVFFGILAIPSLEILHDGESFAPLYKSIVPIMTIAFFLPGLIYGVITGSLRSEKQVAQMTSESMATMGGYIVLAFFAAQFVAYFGWSNLGQILAIQGAGGLKAIGLTGLPLLVAFTLLASFINLFVGSASAKWALMAPIFVPMLMMMGYSPETTQAAYRIGDSYSNIITPLLPYFPIVVTFAAKYVKGIGIGTIISLMLPFSLAFAAIRIPTFVIWILFGLPLGVDAEITFSFTP